jgi:hypothetical protein
MDYPVSQRLRSVSIRVVHGKIAVGGTMIADVGGKRRSRTEAGSGEGRTAAAHGSLKGRLNQGARGKVLHFLPGPRGGIMHHPRARRPL